MAMVLALIDLVCSLVLVKLMTQITEDWNFSDAQGRWSALRRFVYISVACALFAKGLYRLDEPERVSVLDLVTQIVILSGLMVFPIMRALGFISQDQWKDVNGR
jgi:hypothetical protein